MWSLTEGGQLWELNYKEGLYQEELLTHLLYGREFIARGI